MQPGLKQVHEPKAIPGVISAAYSYGLPLTTNSGSSNGGSASFGGEATRTHVEWIEGRVSAGYFSTMGIRLVRGRDFAATDRAGAPPVVIMNEEFVRRYMQGEATVGNRIKYGERERGFDAEIVAVAANSKHFTLGENQRAAIYFPLEQRLGGINLGFIIVRASGDPAALVNVVRSALREIDRSVSVQVEPMKSTLAFALLPSQVGGDGSLVRRAWINPDGVWTLCDCGVQCEPPSARS